VSRVLDQRADFLRLLEARGLVPGEDITVTGRSDQADTVEVETTRGGRFGLGSRAAEKVLVESAVALGRDRGP
jgi:Fe2+ transport system protein FeoA